MKIWIATAVDYGDTCDGKARVVGVFKSYDEAKNYVDEDIRQWIDERAGLAVGCDFAKMAAWFENDDDSCEWNIEEKEI